MTSLFSKKTSVYYLKTKTKKCYKLLNKKLKYVNLTALKLFKRYKALKGTFLNLVKFFSKQIFFL